MPIRIVFETHSTTEDNENGVATGWLPGRLSKVGREQAAELGRRRADDGIAAVFSSDLARATQTAAIAFAGTGIPVLLDWRLRECDYGELNGSSARDLEWHRPEHVDQPYPGGESWQQAARTWQSSEAAKVRRSEVVTAAGPAGWPTGRRHPRLADTTAPLAVGAAQLGVAVVQTGQLSSRGTGRPRSRRSRRGGRRRLRSSRPGTCRRRTVLAGSGGAAGRLRAPRRRRLPTLRSTAADARCARQPVRGCSGAHIGGPLLGHQHAEIGMHLGPPRVRTPGEVHSIEVRRKARGSESAAFPISARRPP